MWIAPLIDVKMWRLQSAGVSAEMFLTEHGLFYWRDSIAPLQLGRRLDFNPPGREYSGKPDVFYDLYQGNRRVWWFGTWA
jgi:hypothetical protein